MDEKLEKEIKFYLDKLRKSGVVNMFGSKRFIMEEFGLDDIEATKALVNWMRNFKEE